MRLDPFYRDPSLTPPPPPKKKTASKNHDARKTSISLFFGGRSLKHQVKETKKNCILPQSPKEKTSSHHILSKSILYIALLYFLTLLRGARFSQTCSHNIFPALTIYVTLGNPGQYIGRHQFLHPGRGCWQTKSSWECPTFLEWIIV